MFLWKAFFLQLGAVLRKSFFPWTQPLCRFWGLSVLCNKFDGASISFFMRKGASSSEIVYFEKWGNRIIPSFQRPKNVRDKTRLLILNSLKVATSDKDLWAPRGSSETSLRILSNTWRNTLVPLLFYRIKWTSVCNGGTCDKALTEKGWSDWSIVSFVKFFSLQTILLLSL